MSDDSSTANTEAEVPVLDGVWLRRERERIATGRRQVAERLGLPESQVSRVEMNKRLVPSEWFAALAELGFPVPSNLLAADSASWRDDMVEMVGHAAEELRTLFYKTWRRAVFKRLPSDAAGGIDGHRQHSRPLVEPARRRSWQVDRHRLVKQRCGNDENHQQHQHHVDQRCGVDFRHRLTRAVVIE